MTGHADRIDSSPHITGIVLRNMHYVPSDYTAQAI